jgi:hypothetical protein
MAILNTLDIPHLKNNLRWAILRNCQPEWDRSGAETFRFGEFSDIRILIGPQTIEILSEQLSRWVSLYDPTDPKPLPIVLSRVAIMAMRAGPKVFGPPIESAQLLERMISTDFALVCVLGVTNSRGYPIPIRRIPWNKVQAALINDEEESLAGIFKACLGAAWHAATKPRSTDRTLSTKSYWNLWSVAEIEGWDEPIILRLIEEYLSPAPSPQFACYSNVVSGNEWRQIYEWICGLDECEL